MFGAAGIQPAKARGFEQAPKAKGRGVGRGQGQSPPCTIFVGFSCLSVGWLRLESSLRQSQMIKRNGEKSRDMCDTRRVFISFL